VAQVVVAVLVDMELYQQLAVLVVALVY